MTSPTPEPGNGTRYRIDEAFRRIELLEHKLDQQKYDALLVRVEQVENRLSWQTVALFSAAVSIVLTALGFALAVLSGTIG